MIPLEMLGYSGKVEFLCRWGGARDKRKVSDAVKEKM